MSRFPLVSEHEASYAQRDVLGTVRGRMGRVPNMMLALLNSPTAARAYLRFSGAVEEGALSPRLRTLIALAIAQQNLCDYSLALQTHLGRQDGLPAADMIEARRGRSSDPREAAALRLALSLRAHNGQVADDELEAARAAGLDHAAIIEVLTHVALNTFANAFNRLAATSIDYPPADPLP